MPTRSKPYSDESKTGYGLEEPNILERLIKEFIGRTSGTPPAEDNTYREPEGREPPNWLEEWAMRVNGDPLATPLEGILANEPPDLQPGEGIQLDPNGVLGEWLRRVSGEAGMDEQRFMNELERIVKGGGSSDQDYQKLMPPRDFPATEAESSWRGR